MESIEGGSIPAEQTAIATARERRGILAAVFKSRATLFVVGAIIIGVVFRYLQFSTASLCCGDFDSYYHLRWSRMLWEGMRAGHFPPAFNALPLTTLNPKDYVDHHLLFHVLQIPFTFFSDIQTGGKIAAWLFACLAVFSCYWLIIRNRLSYPLVWLVAIMGSSAPFLFRMDMGKAMSISIVLMVAGIHLLFERKYVWLLPLAFVFALTYDMVLLLWVAAFFWLVVTAWQERALNREVAWALAACVIVVVGTALGFVINPYFPHNVALLVEHFIIKVTPKNFSTPVGSEWYPYDTWEFLANCGVALVAMFAGYLAFRDSASKDRKRAFFLLFFSTFLMIVNMRWRRFAEYFPPFAVLFAAFALEPLIRRARAGQTAVEPAAVADASEVAADASEEVGTDGEPLPAPAPASTRVERARAWEVVIVCTAFVLLAAPLGWNMYATAQDIRGMAQPNFYRGGVEWLSQHADKGELIFNTDWDDFPKLFFYNPDLSYISGLDPTYLVDRNHEQADLFAKITIAKDLNDEEVANLGPMIRDNFCVGEGDRRRCARYVFTDHEHEEFYNDALDSGWFDEVYSDGDCAVLKIRDQKGTPVPDNKPDNDDSDSDDDDNSQGN
ncbi:MAG TPA: hypothetical protein VLJ61_03305 [Pyrinomonadaceae bacterium]|nr:hypothetical protein [Pyrinomonadaceae bacterium]